MNTSNNQEEKTEDEIFCLDCDKYYKNIDEFTKVHEKTVFKVLDQKHSYITEKNSFQLITDLFKSNKLLISAIKEQQNSIKELTKRLELYEDSLKDVSFDCNIIVKNGTKKLKNLGKCNLQYFPRNINFRIECKGDILKDEKNKFQIDIMFPFREINLKQCSIEKFTGCYFTQEISDTEGNITSYYHNYNCYLEQNKNCIISIKSIKDFLLPGKFEKQNINVIINGMISFESLFTNFDIPVIIYNILDKTFLCYENYQWKFVDEFILENGDINKNCLVNILIKDENKVQIKGEHKYIGFEPNYSTLDEKESLLDISFVNKIYGLVQFSKNGKFLAMDKNTNVFYGNEKTYYLICNA